MAMWGSIGLFAGGKKKHKVIAGENEAVITGAMAASRDNHYNSVVLLFQGAGFRNVSAVPLHDLTILNVARNGKVDTVTINGSSDFEEGDVFPRDSKVLIPYHSR